MTDEPCPGCGEAPDHHPWECYPPMNHDEYARLLARHATL